MNILLNYIGGGKFKNSQKMNVFSGLLNGFNVVYKMNDFDIDRTFYNRHRKLLEQPKGAGYWSWKSYFINKIIHNIGPDDVLFYSDSGSIFIKDMTPILDFVRQDEKGVVGFKLSGNHIEKIWTKRDIFIATDTNIPSITDSPQIMATFMAYRGTEFAKFFANEFIKFCTDFHLISDEPNHDGYVEPNFQENRWDQSIWSVLSKKYNTSILPDPTQWSLITNESTGPNLYINHTRDRS